MSSSPESPPKSPAPSVPRSSFSISSILGDTEKKEEKTDENDEKSCESKDAIISSISDIYSKYQVLSDAALAARPGFNFWYPWYSSFMQSQVDFSGKQISYFINIAFCICIIYFLN